MPSRGETDHPDLVYAPFRCMVATVPEGILHVLQRNLAMPVRKAVLDNRAGDAPVVHPFRYIGAFVPNRQPAIAAAGGADDHLPVGALGKIEIHPRAVGHVSDETFPGGLLGACETVRNSRPFGHGNSVLHNTLGGHLAQRIQVDRPVGREVQSRIAEPAFYGNRLIPG